MKNIQFYKETNEILLLNSFGTPICGTQNDLYKRLIIDCVRLRKFKDVDLSNSELIGIEILAGEAENINFENSNLSYSNLKGSKFKNCNFTNVKFNFCEFRMSQFENCKFSRDLEEYLIQIGNYNLNINNPQ